MSEVKKIWDDGADVYDEIYSHDIPYHRSHDVVADLLPKGKPLHVLDLGSGTGSLGRRILQRSPESRVVCLEFSSAMVAKAKVKLAPFGDRVEFVCADLREWVPSLQYDAVVTCNALVYRELDLQDCYAKYARCLAEGGLFLSSTVTLGTEPLEGLMTNLAGSDVPEYSEKLLAFAQGPAKAIASFAPESLAVAYTLAEHLEFMTNAGLQASVPWQYLTQAIVLGVSNKRMQPTHESG